MLIDVLMPVCLIWMYWHWTQGELLPPNPRPRGMVAISTLRIQFCIHACLFVLLAIATFIDFDERMIPDLVTTPATLLALIGSALIPDWHLYYQPQGSVSLEHLHAASPFPWPIDWNQANGLILAISSYSLWCFALANRRWIMRRGFRKAVQYFFAGLIRDPAWKILVIIWVVGLIGIALGYCLLSPAAWQSLFSSVIGMTVGCSIVWAIRLVAGFAMQVEAMGFGDVTLMAMVGAFLGWQPAWLAFFLAPMMAVLIVLIVYGITGDLATPFGPYLAAATMVVLLFWDAVFNQWAMDRMLMVGSLGFWFLFGFLLLLGVVLWLWNQLKQVLFSSGHPSHPGN